MIEELSSRNSRPNNLSNHLLPLLATPPLPHSCELSRAGWPLIDCYTATTVTTVIVRWPSIKPGRWNIPEHSGTSRKHPVTSNNYDNYEKKMYKLKFFACASDHLKRSDWSRRSRNMFLFASRTTLFRNESYGRTFHRGKSIEKVYEVTDY